MSADTTKKRKTDGGDSQGDYDVEISDNGTTMAAVLAKINDMESRYTSLQNEMNGMKDKCTYLENRCDSLERSVMVLSKESKWEWSVPPISFSNWRDFDEDYLERIDSFLDAIKSNTHQLRSGECTDIHLSFGEDSEDTLISHDDILLPHWRELANAIQLGLVRPNSQRFLNTISIYNVQLTSSVMDLLTPALKSKEIDMLTLNNNDFVNIREGIKFAVDVMESNPNMKHFLWEHNQLDSMENARSVLDAVISHPSIDRIRLENCLHDGNINGYDVLCYLLTSGKRFEHIECDNNNIQTRGGTAIPEYIASNPPLTRLHLLDNVLNDDDAILIAQALKQNDNLHVIVLGGNMITHTGKEALLKVVYDPTNLNSMSDSNHSCRIAGVDIPILSFLNNASRNVREWREWKIYNLLSKRNEEGSNVQHLKLEFDGVDEENNNSLKLTPDVLEVVHKYYANPNQMPTYQIRVRPLSIMYEIVRGWKMPELYESKVGTS